MWYCGLYPADYYGGSKAGYAFIEPWFLILMVLLALVFIGLYLLSWFLSKDRKVGWMTFALAFFSLDTFCLLTFGMYMGIGFLIDLAFHAWVIVSLSMGIHAHYAALRQPPPQSAMAYGATRCEDSLDATSAAPSGQDSLDADTPEAPAGERMPPNSPVLRRADTTKKGRVLAEAETQGYEICYRRIGRVNELIVNGMVYDELVALVETAHVLTAWIDGHRIEGGFDGAGHSYIRVDSVTVARKLRLI